jgi:serine/threonine-protein kinase
VEPVANGTLDIRVNPWGEVLKGSHSLGVTPMAPIELPAGSYTLRIENPDLKKTRSVTAVIQPGKTTLIQVDLLE